jgi:hypothetical protein
MPKPCGTPGRRKSLKHKQACYMQLYAVMRHKILEFLQIGSAAIHGGEKNVKKY